MATTTTMRPVTILLIATAVTIFATAGGLALTGGFAPLLANGLGGPILFSLLAIVGAGISFTYVLASLIAGRNYRSPPVDMLIRPIVIEEDEKPVVAGEAPLDIALRKLDRLVGLAPVKEEVSTLMARLQTEKRRRDQGLSVAALSQHMVFTGPPGVGKTEVARLVGEIFKALDVLRKGHVVEVDRGDLVADVIGGTAIKTGEKCREALDGILFIDEAYSLASHAGTGPDFGREAIETVLKFMEDYRDRLVVIVAGYSVQMETFMKSNPGLKSRFSKTIDFPSYSTDELIDILSRMAESQNFALPLSTSEILKPWILAHSGQPDWGNARSIRSLLERIRESQAIRVASQPHADLSRIESADIERAIRVR